MTRAQRRRRRALGAIAVVAASVTSWSAASPASAESRQSAPVELRVLSTDLVAGDAGWNARLQLLNAPLDARIVTDVHRALPNDEIRLRAALDSLATTPVRTATLLTARTPIAETLTASGEVTVAVATRSLPRAGTFPVVIRIVPAADDATVLAETVLYLVRAPTRDETKQLEVSFVAAAHSAPALAPDGTTALPDAASARLERWAALARSDRSDTTMFAIDAQELSALDASAEGGDPDLRESLRSGLAGHPIARAPWVPTDIGSWVASGAPTDLQPLLVAAQDQLGNDLGSPADGRIWFPDPSIGPASVAFLRSIGVDRMLVDNASVDRDGLPTRDAGLLRNFTVGPPEHLTIAHSVDPDLTGLVSRSVTDPVATSNRVAAALAALWLLDPGAKRGVVIDASDTPAALGAALYDTLGAGASAGSSGIATVVEVARLADLFDRSDISRRGRSGDALTRALSDPPITDVSSRASRLRQARRSANSHRALLVSPDPRVELIERLITSSMHRDLDTAASRAYLDRAIEQIDADLGAITAPQASTITVTSRDAVIPINVGNGLDREVEVSLSLRSPRLEFPDGARRTLRLRPGSNRIDVNVGVRTSGEFPVTVEISTPDDVVVIAKSELRLRSTTFSGVGVGLSIGAIAVLLIWWLRTARRTRRLRDEPTEPRR